MRRLPLGGWLVVLAVVLALAGWIWILAWFVDHEGGGGVAVALVTTPFLLLAALPLRRVRRPGFRLRTGLCAVLVLLGSVVLLWVGGLAFFPSGVALVVATLAGGGRPAGS